MAWEPCTEGRLALPREGLVTSSDALTQRLIELRSGPAAPPAGALGDDEVKAIRLTAAEGYW